jgi:hypothetical protein
MNLTELFQVVQPRLTDAGAYGWSCFGDDVRSLDLNDEVMVIFDTMTQKVYAIYFFEYENDTTQETAWVEPKYKKVYLKFCAEHQAFADPMPRIISLKKMLAIVKEKVNRGE